MAQFKENSVIGNIKPLASGTRVRVAPTTFSTVVNSCAAGIEVSIDLVREYTETVTNEYIIVGDKWGRVTAINGQPPKDTNGKLVTNVWMAIKYQRATPSQICAENYTIVENGDGDGPTPAQKWIGATLIPKLDNGQDGEPIHMVVES